MRLVSLLLLLFPAIGMAEPLRVFVSVLPMQTFVEKVGADHVDVRTMVQPGYSPATYDPTPQQMAALAKAVLYIRTGVPFENAWMARIRSANPDIQVLDARSGIELRWIEAHEHEHDREGHSAGYQSHESDPHIWTSPPQVKHMIKLIRDRLVELDPVNAADYHRNHAAFARQLELLDQDIHALLDPLRNRKFMVFHPSWGYFADTYDLVQIPIEYEGKEPGARVLVALIDQAKRENIRVIFVQPQFDRRKAKQVARAIDGSVIAVDPLAVNYVDNLRAVARQFAETLEP